MTKLKLWSLRYSIASGNRLILERSLLESDAQSWLKVFREDEPDVLFIVSDKKPKKRYSDGIRLYNNDEIFAFVKKPINCDNAFIVSATQYPEGISYMFTLDTLSERFLGLDKVGYMVQTEMFNKLFEE